MWKDICVYIKDCTLLSLKGSYSAANGGLGAAFVAGAMSLFGTLKFVAGNSTFNNAENSAITVIFYIVIALLILWIGRTLLIAPFILYMRQKKQVADL